MTCVHYHAFTKYILCPLIVEKWKFYIFNVTTTRYEARFLLPFDEKMVTSHAISTLTLYSLINRFRLDWSLCFLGFFLEFLQCYSDKRKKQRSFWNQVLLILCNKYLVFQHNLLWHNTESHHSLLSQYQTFIQKMSSNKFVTFVPWSVC